MKYIVFYWPGVNSIAHGKLNRVPLNIFISGLLFQKQVMIRDKVKSTILPDVMAFSDFMEAYRDSIVFLTRGQDLSNVGTT